MSRVLLVEKAMSAKINVERAEINTATIQVKTLMVNARKLTLSVFRQIFEEDLVDQDRMIFNGVPWGMVNYYWGDLNTSYQHIVWQKGNELRRSLVPSCCQSEEHLHNIDFSASLSRAYYENGSYIFDRRVRSLHDCFDYRLRKQGESIQAYKATLLESIKYIQCCIDITNNKYRLVIEPLSSLPHLMIAV